MADSSGCAVAQYVSEAVAALAEAGFKVKDISAAVQVTALLSPASALPLLPSLPS